MDGCITNNIAGNLLPRPLFFSNGRNILPDFILEHSQLLV